MVVPHPAPRSGLAPASASTSKPAARRAPCLVTSFLSFSICLACALACTCFLLMSACGVAATTQQPHVGLQSAWRHPTTHPTTPQQPGRNPSALPWHHTCALAKHAPHLGFLDLLPRLVQLGLERFEFLATWQAGITTPVEVCNDCQCEINTDCALRGPQHNQSDARTRATATVHPLQTSCPCQLPPPHTLRQPATHPRSQSWPPAPWPCW